MDIQDIKTQITDYIINCGEDPSKWDVEGMTDAIKNSGEFDDIQSIDDIDEDRFSEMLQYWAI